MFKLTHGKGFSITLPNNWEVSIQWGAGSYAGNRLDRSNPFDKTNPQYGMWESRTAEIMAWNQYTEEVIRFPTKQEVLGDCTVQQVLEFVSAIGKLLPEEYSIHDYRARAELEDWERKWFPEEKDIPQFNKNSGYIDKMTIVENDNS